MKLVRTIAPSMLLTLLLACGGDDSKQAKAPQTTAGETSYGSTTPSTAPSGTSMTGTGTGMGTSGTATGTGSNMGTSGTTTSGSMGSTDTSGTGSSGTGVGTTGAGSTSGTSGAGSSGTGASNMTFTDAEIAAVVASVNTGEVEEGKLAQKKAKDAKVKNFANKMVQHHTTANTKQADLLKKLKMSTSENATSRELASDSSNTVEQLKNQSGNDFDKAYIDAMVKDHQKALSMIDDKLIPQAKSSELKQELQTLRSQIDSHLREAMDIQKSLNK